MSQMTPAVSQRQSLQNLFTAQPLRRARELQAAGISPATIARATQEGIIERVTRGLYQSSSAQIDTNQALAEASKRLPKGTIAMVSAFAFHGLTDQMPRTVWMAIGGSDWAPASTYPPIRIVRFSRRYLAQGIEHYEIAGVKVPIYSIAKTLADAFRNPNLVDRSVAIEALKSALTQRKVLLSDIISAAKEGGAWTVMRPYLEALTSDG
jgi:predicted transcriptional regulator of viral defense system